MFGWLAQAEPILVDSRQQLLILLAALILGAFVLFVLILVMITSRLQKARHDDKEVQSRLDDLRPTDYQAPPLPPAKSPSSPKAATSSLTPIEQKLLAAERAETAATPTISAAQESESPAETGTLKPESDLPVAGIFGELNMENDVDVDALWDDLNIEFEKEGELAFLLGEDLPDIEEPELPLPLTILADINARHFLDQVNQYRLQQRGVITETERECRLSWQSAGGEQEILVTAQDTETLTVNGALYPATEDGLKQGIVAALKSATY